MIRTMTIEDYDSVMELWESIPGMGLRSLDDSLKGIEKYLKRNPKTCFVSEDELIHGSILSGHDGRRGFIYHLAVAESYRGLGIGKQLVDKALIALKEEGIKKVALVVFKDNQVGNDFWNKYGFNKRDDLYYRNLSLDKDNL
jgi:ribosomal protein S18 acetylase RimI-like enzyme